MNFTVKDESIVSQHLSGHVASPCLLYRSQQISTGHKGPHWWGLLRPSMPDSSFALCWWGRKRQLQSEEQTHTLRGKKTDICGSLPWGRSEPKQHRTLWACICGFCLVQSVLDLVCSLCNSEQAVCLLHSWRFFLASLSPGEGKKGLSAMKWSYVSVRFWMSDERCAVERPMSSVQSGKKWSIKFSTMKN